MAADIIIMDGDELKFHPIPGVSIIPMRPTIIKASGKTTINGQKVCVEGDEEKVVIPCLYSKPPFVNGVGKLMIEKLADDQLSVKSTSGNKCMILQGKKFKSRFQAMVKAVNPANGAMDPGDYSGKGEFKPANEKIKAT